MKTRTGLFALITALLLYAPGGVCRAGDGGHRTDNCGCKKAAVLVEYSTGKILYEMEADRRLPVASMTK